MVNQMKDLNGINARPTVYLVSPTSLLEEYVANAVCRMHGNDRAILDSLSIVLNKAGIECSSFVDPKEFLAASDNEEVGCVIVDLLMPIMTGIELLRELNSRKFIVPVVILTGYSTVATAVEAMKLGAVDYLEKPVEHPKLIGAIQRSLEIVQQRSREKESAEVIESKIRTLTSRQREVMDCIAEGLPSKQIAKKLQISIKTVEVHRSQLAKKLGATSLATLIQLITRFNLGKSA